MPRTARVYRVQPAEITEASLRQAMAKYRAVSPDVWRITLAAGGRYMMSGDHDDRGADRPAPGDAVARRTADAFLALTGLLPAGTRFARVFDQEVVTSGLGTKPGDRVVLSKGVVYERLLDGIPAGTLTVCVGAGGKIVGVYNHIAAVDAGTPVPILTPVEVVQQLRAGKGFVADGGLGVVAIESITLTYWQPAFAQELPYLRPVYLITERGGGVEPPTRIYLDALRPEYLR